MRKKNIGLIILILILAFSMTACKNKTESKFETDFQQTTSEVVIIDNSKSDNEGDIKNSDDEIDKPKDGMAKSLLTGLYIDENMINQRPIVAMLDNHYMARPQAGLKDADIVYEILAEGRITRYMAVFQSVIPNYIAPIRSSRPYFISKALEYDPYYVHVGGSPQALSDIKALNMADIDGLSCGSNVFWRESHKRIPHNMYSSGSAVIKEAKRRGYRENPNLQRLKFNDEIIELDGDVCTALDIVYKYPNSYDGVGYHSGFVYDKQTGLYNRMVNGKLYYDENGEKPLSTENIIIQRAIHRVIDNEGRRKIDLIGEGSGYYISKGKVIPITWKKKDRADLTRYYDKDGNELSLNRGKIWIQVVETRKCGNGNDFISFAGEDIKKEIGTNDKE